MAGDSETAKQVILSILHHVSNSHVFPALHLFSKCGHGPIEQEKEWIKPGSYIFCSSFHPPTHFGELFQNSKAFLWCLSLALLVFLGSVALERLREAILGRDGRNLADVEYMSGRNVL